MRNIVSSANLRTQNGTAAPLRVIPGGLSAPNVGRMAQRTASGTPAASEEEMRERLVYWVKDRMGRVGIGSIRELASEMGLPNTTVARWFGGKATGGVPLVWMGELCRVLRVDPAWFVLLPPVPEDPSGPFALPDQDPLLVALGAARLARRDSAEAAAAARLAAAPRPAQPRTRAARSGR